MRDRGEWKTGFYKQEDYDTLVKAGYMPLVSALLCARGVTEPESARELLRDDLGLLSDPFLMLDMDKAVLRIRQAVENNEHVAVYGDYDVDGITSTCLVTGYLRGKGLRCEVYIPERLTEGYGVSDEALYSLKELGVSLIITVDCGITAVSQVELANTLGIDMLITDHHECPDELPRAVAVVNPRRKDCPYPFKGLAGVGVAFKLLCALDAGVAPEELMEKYGDLTAIGTIADIMPLTGENRAIVRGGIEVLKRGGRLGIRKLMEETGLSKEKISSADISFNLVPKLNAAGRMGKVELSYELLMSEDEKGAAALAAELCSLNQERRAVENRIYTEAVEMVEGAEIDGVIVLSSESWHLGVSGIVASRLAERFGVPAIVICVEGDEGRGSCRSFGGFCIFNALEASKEYLTSFGGHAYAAGLTLKKEDIEAFTACVRENFKKSMTAKAQMKIDLEVSDPKMLSLRDVEALSELAPWGNSNPPPLLCIQGVRIETIIPIGGERHLKIKIGKNGASFECVYFSMTAKEFGLKPGAYADFAFEPVVNDFRGTRTVQLVLRDARSSFKRELEELEFCGKFLNGETLSESDIRKITPDRDDFAAVWRVISAAEYEGSAELLPRDISRSACVSGLGKVYICLKVFDELGLADMSEDCGQLKIMARKDTEKIDLNTSKILTKLKGL